MASSVSKLLKTFESAQSEKLKAVLENPVFGFLDMKFTFDSADTIQGGKNRDNMLGGLGDDQLTGREGNDVLVGDAGYVIFRGDASNDAFYSHDIELKHVENL